jgi:hypothetical protein
MIGFLYLDLVKSTICPKNLRVFFEGLGNMTER